MYISISSFSSELRPVIAGAGGQARRFPPGPLKLRCQPVGFRLSYTEFSSRFGPMHLCRVQGSLALMRLFGSRSLSEYGLGGPSATSGFLLQCADPSAPTFFLVLAPVLQNPVHTGRQGAGDRRLGYVRLLAPAQAAIALGERITELNGHIGRGDRDRSDHGLGDLICPLQKG